MIEDYRPGPDRHQREHGQEREHQEVYGTCIARFALLLMLGSTEIPPVDISPMGMRRLIATRFLVLPS